ncbi:MAG: hypothetical protein GQ553_02015 [Nitrosomonadaceae bacterium]|nr:hypothetical protein [Nitrosomonadaceae bacterium]
MAKTIKDYSPRMGYFPSYKQPKYLGKDEEFAYFEFRVPHAHRNKTHIDPSGLLPDTWHLNMKSLLVHTGIELIDQDETFLYLKCKIPLIIFNSHYATGYHLDVEHYVDKPDPERELQDIFDRVKNEELKEYQQYEITFICERCKQQETEIHQDPIAGLVQRHCGNCQFTVLKLASYKGLWPEGKI